MKKKSLLMFVCLAVIGIALTFAGCGSSAPKKISVSYKNIELTTSSLTIQTTYGSELELEDISVELTLEDNSTSTITSGTEDTNYSINWGDFKNDGSDAVGTYDVIFSYEGVDDIEVSINVVRKQLTITGTTVANKVYDGTTTGVVTPGTLAGKVGTDVVGVTATAAFVSANAATDADVSVSYTLTGSAKNNYIAPVRQTLQADITAKQLTIAGTTVADKVYDGTTAGVATPGTLAGKIGTDIVGVTTTATFASVDAATDINVSVVYSLIGADKDNYIAPVTEPLQADITAKQLTITETTVANKIYDGTTDGVVTLGTLAGKVGTEDVGVTATAAFASVDAATDIDVSVVYSLIGADKDNYIAPATETLQADIAAKQLTIAETTVADKIYDGTTDGVVTLGTLAGKVGTEDVGVTATAAFASVDAATDIDVSVVYSLTGADKDNYIAPATETLQADITAKQLTITGTTVADKVYDGTTDGVVTPGTLAGKVGTEDVGVTATATFASVDAATDINVSVVYSLTGADKDNYIAPVTHTLQADITAKQLTITGTTVADKVYDGTTDGVVTLGTLAGKVGTEDVGVTATATFASVDAATDINVSVVYTLIGDDKANYIAPVTETLQATIEGAVEEIATLAEFNTAIASTNIKEVVVTASIALEDNTVLRQGLIVTIEEGISITIPAGKKLTLSSGSLVEVKTGMQQLAAMGTVEVMAGATIKVNKTVEAVKYYYNYFGNDKNSMFTLSAGGTATITAKIVGANVRTKIDVVGDLTMQPAIAIGTDDTVIRNTHYLQGGDEMNITGNITAAEGAHIEVQDGSTLTYSGELTGDITRTGTGMITDTNPPI